MNLPTTQVFLRFSLAAGFLSASADRFGLWRKPGEANVGWGTWDSFVEYVGVLNPYAPVGMLGVLAWVATIAEIALGVSLMIGFQKRWVALASGILLLSFAVAMALSLGIKAPLDYSVFPASLAAFLLYKLELETENRERKG